MFCVSFPPSQVSQQQPRSRYVLKRTTAILHCQHTAVLHLLGETTSPLAGQHTHKILHFGWALEQDVVGYVLGRSHPIKLSHSQHGPRGPARQKAAQLGRASQKGNYSPNTFSV